VLVEREVKLVEWEEKTSTLQNSCLLHPPHRRRQRGLLLSVQYEMCLDEVPALNLFHEVLC